MTNKEKRTDWNSRAASEYNLKTSEKVGLPQNRIKRALGQYLFVENAKKYCVSEQKVGLT